MLVPHIFGSALVALLISFHERAAIFAARFVGNRLDIGVDAGVGLRCLQLCHKCQYRQQDAALQIRSEIILTSVREGVVVHC